MKVTVKPRGAEVTFVFTHWIVFMVAAFLFTRASGAFAQGAGSLEFSIDNVSASNGYADGGTGGAVGVGTQLTAGVAVRGAQGNQGSVTVWCYQDGRQVFTWTTTTDGQKTFQWTAPAYGTYTFYCTGTWSGNYAHGTVTTSNVSVPVGYVTRLNVTASSNPISYGSPVTFTATITTGATGQILFYDGSTQIGSGTITGTVATYQTSTLGAGTHNISASYAGSGPYLASTAAPISFTVNPVTPSLNVTSSGPTSYMDPVNLNAAISNGLSGTVTFYDNGAFIGSAQISGGNAPFTTAALKAGSHSITASWPGNGNYTAVISAPITQIVSKVTPTINWTQPAAITYGTALSGVQLNASASAPGSFSYSPSIGSVPPAGVQSLSVTLTPSDSLDYNSNSKSVSITVNPATPGLNLSSSGPSSYGSTVNFSASITNGLSGTVTFYDNGNLIGGAPIVGSTASLPVSSLTAGSHSITAKWPGNSNFNPVTAGPITQTVASGTPVISWGQPAPITYGTALSATQLNASSNVPGNFSYSPALGSVLGAGSPTLSVTFTPTDTANYGSVSRSVSITVNRANPVISWPALVAVANGTVLSSTQLNATANIPGTFTYSPAAGTTLTEGNHVLALQFTPSDQSDYLNASASNTIAVSLAPGPGIIVTVAGNGQSASAGDNGFAVSASLVAGGVAIDGTGNLYVIDSNDMVRKISPDGVIRTIAGQAKFGFAGDGGPAISAVFYYLQGIAVDGSGNIYVSDMGNARIRKININGIITTVAGNGNFGNGGDNGPATSAELTSPRGIAVDAQGNLYIADANGYRVRKVDTNGIITTLAGTGAYGFSGDGGPAVNAKIGVPYGIAVDASGNVYIDDEGNNRIREVLAANGTIVTVAGTGVAGYAGDGGLAVNAKINVSFGGIAVDSVGNLYIDDNQNYVVRKVTAASGTISTIAGNGTTGYSGDGGPATAAQITYSDTGIAVDGLHNVVIADQLHVRAIGASRTTPILSWTAPSDIVFGTPLGANQLNATAGGVPGTFTYSPGSGTKLPAGQQTLSVRFQTSDPGDFTTTPITATVPITIDKATPVINWNPAPIQAGSKISSAQLDAVAVGVDGALLPGIFNYSVQIGTTVSAGSLPISVTFLPSDSSNYTTASDQISLNVAPGSTFDQGVVNVFIDSKVASTAVYGEKDTPASIAESLANPQNISSDSPVNITAVNDQIYLIAKSANGDTNYEYEVTAKSSEFSTASFAGSPASGRLTGGADPTSGSANPVQIYSYSVPANGYDAVGNLVSYTDSVMGSWNFNYDTLNRLSGALTNQAGNPQPYYCWNYDAFGNRLQQESSSQQFSSPSGGSNPCTSQSSSALTVETASYAVNGRDPGTNQITSSNARGSAAIFGYDSAGDVAYDGANSYLYDADGRICAVQSSPLPGLSSMIGYLYDAIGNRVGKGTITSWSCDSTSNGFEPVNDYILGVSNEQLTEMAVNVSGNTTSLVWEHTNVWAGSSLLGTYDQDGLHFYLNDPLGTRRVQADFTGNVEQNCSSLPFGDGESCGTTPSEHLFTGKERDAESGNDYFGARYYASAVGRWLSPDWAVKPEPVPYAELDDPQSLNLYVYLNNNPLAKVDPDGHCCWNIAKQWVAEHPRTSQAIGGVAKGAVGVGLVATIAAGDVPGSAVGVGLVVSGTISAVSSVVSGVTDIAAAATNTNVENAQKALDGVGNGPALLTSAATGGNLAAGAAVGTLADAAQLATKPQEALKNPATMADAAKTMSGIVDLGESAASAVRGALARNPTAPPAPKPPAPPTCHQVTGGCR